MRWLTLGAVLFFAAFCHPVQAAIIVDPNNVGATDIDPADPTTWTSDTDGFIGQTADGSIRVDGGSELLSRLGYLGDLPSSTGEATITGAGSQWNTGWLNVGFGGSGTLSVEAGGRVTSDDGYIGTDFFFFRGGTGEATITGAGSQWNNTGGLVVGGGDSGILNITDCGLVGVAATLSIYSGTDRDGFVNMATGGMLALASDEQGDDSLNDFLALIDGTDDIRYYDTTLPGWAHITAATEGVDYTLDYHTTGDLAGYTVLTVFTPIPEPSATVMLGLAATLFAASRRRRN